MVSPEEPQSRRQLAVDLADLALALAFEDASGEISHYLDLETGAVIVVTDKVHRELERIYAEVAGDGGIDPTWFAEALARRQLPGWRAEALHEADQVEEGFGTRYVRVPGADSREGYRDMEAFIDTIRSPGLQERLADAIRGRGAFRRFKDALARYPSERARWFAFRDARLRERILSWLVEEEIEPVLGERSP